MVKCALCGTPGVNKSSCPLNIKDPKPENWKKHYKAKKHRKTTKPKHTVVSKPKRIVLKPQTIKTPVSIGRTPPTRFTNSYVAKSREVSLVKRKIMASASKTKMIVLHGDDLVHFHVYIKHPETFKVKLNKSPAINKKLDQILQLILDIYISMSKKLVTRVDFFTRPDASIKNLIDMLEESKIQLIKFIIKHRDGGGGGEIAPSFTAPLDEMIGDLDLLAVDTALSTLTSVSSLAKIPTSVKTKGKKIGMTAGKKTRRKHHLKKTIHKRKY